MDTLHTRVEAIRRLARKGAGSALARTVVKSRPEDIAAALAHLAPSEQRTLLAEIKDDEVAAVVLSELDQGDLKNLVVHLSFERLIRLLGHMEVDDEADIIAWLPEDLRARVLEAIHDEDKEHVEDILAWPDDSAGGIMQPLAFRLRENLTCRDAISALQEAEDLEMVFYLYVDNDNGQLVGVTSLRNLLTHPPSTVLSEIVATDVISVLPTVDQEEVARIVTRYDLLAVPVCDESRSLLGIVTIDDVVDVIKEEAAEDMMLMAGVGDEPDPDAVSVVRAFRLRLPWLSVTLTAGMVLSLVINHFEEPLTAVPVLAGFIPVMMGVGGNVGIQAATIAVRNVALGRANTRGTFGLVFREAQVGLLLGLVFAVCLAIFGSIVGHDILVGATVGTAIICTIVAAASLGTLIPLTLNKLGADPAVATGPFVTSGVDVIAIVIYFTTCQLMMGV